jgi:AraC-like DNA-binding protein
MAKSPRGAADASREALPESVASCKPVVRGVVRSHVVAAVRALRARLAEPWTLSALAEEVHLSRSQLVRAFDASVGLPPMACLRLLRVHQMAWLLASTDLSIAQVARSVGWADPNYASRCFHTLYGLSPTEFRRHPQTEPARQDKTASWGATSLSQQIDQLGASQGAGAAAVDKVTPTSDTQPQDAGGHLTACGSRQMPGRGPDPAGRADLPRRYLRSGVGGRVRR